MEQSVASRLAQAFFALYEDAGRNFTETEIIDEITSLARSRSLEISDSQIVSAARVISERMNVLMDNGIHVFDSSQHTPWLNSRAREIDFYFWNRYKEYLHSRKLWNSRNVNVLDEVTNTIIDLIGNPSNLSPWQRRGLIMGSVQSGKTATYTAICNKAIDCGYKIIVIIAGTQENLRRQTQERLDRELVGSDSELFLKNLMSEYTGVGKITHEKLVATFTSKIADFNGAIIRNLGLNISQVNSPVLFVIKKQKDVLSHLIKWLRKFNLATGHLTIDSPMLLIDDEADNASINTRQPDEQPTVINRKIRELLATFSRASYIGVTATPYANIFIDPDNVDDMLKDELFPRDFIYSLSSPDNYIGYQDYFDENGKYAGNIVSINDADQVFPKGNKPSLNSEVLPDSLYEAIRYYLLSCEVLDLRGVDLLHRSMLVNVSSRIPVHNEVASLIQQYLNNIEEDVRWNGRLSDPKKRSLNRNIRDLEETWNKFDLSKKIGVDWSDFLKKLYDSIQTVKVLEVNSSPNSVVNNLDYSNADPDYGLRAIIVGGNALSRGLTIEGLTTSYFFRNSSNYDTLLQMGRWFGYRPNYSDICRIWITNELEECFSHIALATNELRRQLESMKKYGQTPKDFGLMIRTHPDTTDYLLRRLRITANNKMRASEDFEIAISYSKKLIETPRIPLDFECLSRNYLLIRDTIERVSASTEPLINDTSQILWKNIPRELIIELIERFENDPRSITFQPELVGEYIRAHSELSTWDVAIPGGMDSDPFLLSEKFRIKLQQRKIDSGNTKKVIRVNRAKSRVGSRGCTKAGLLKTQINEIESALVSKATNLSDSDYLIKGRDPLLLIHLLKGTIENPSTEQELAECMVKLSESSIPLTALGIGFPDIGVNSDVIKYKMNKTKQQELFADNQTEEDDSNED